MPDAKVMEQWVKALESGEYPQAKNTLHRLVPYAGEADPLMDDESKSVGFCCLGVLCDLAAKAGIVKAEEYGDPAISANGRAVSYNGAESFLPKEVKDWAGLDSTNPYVRHNRAITEEQDYVVNTKLSDLNDLDGKDFGYIAQVIRENWLDADAQSGSPA